METINDYLKFYLDKRVLKFRHYPNLIMLTFDRILNWNNDVYKIYLRTLESLTDEEWMKIDSKFKLGEDDSDYETKDLIIKSAYINLHLINMNVDIFGLVDKKLAYDNELLRK